MSAPVTRTARKEHSCTFCGEPIANGSEYIDVKITPWDHIENDGFYQWRIHGECYRFWNDEYGEHGDYLWDGECGEFKASLEEWKSSDDSTEHHKGDEA